MPGRWVCIAWVAALDRAGTVVQLSSLGGARVSAAAACPSRRSDQWCLTRVGCRSSCHGNLTDGIDAPVSVIMDRVADLPTTRGSSPCRQGRHHAAGRWWQLRRHGKPSGSGGRFGGGHDSRPCSDRSWGYRLSAGHAGRAQRPGQSYSQWTFERCPLFHQIARASRRLKVFNGTLSPTSASTGAPILASGAGSWSIWFFP